MDIKYLIYIPETISQILSKKEMRNLSAYIDKLAIHDVKLQIDYAEAPQKPLSQVYHS